MLVRRGWPSRPAFQDAAFQGAAFQNAFADFDHLRQEMRALLDNASRTDGYDVGSGVFPPMNVTQDGDSFYVRAEVPGIKASELSISAVKNRLTIAGKREIPNEHERASYHRKERPEGSFNRTLTLPTELDVERIDARYVDGILTLKLPKAEAAKPRLISVKT
jgi:HSP20 family protein